MCFLKWFWINFGNFSCRGIFHEHFEHPPPFLLDLFFPPLNIDVADEFIFHCNLLFFPKTFLPLHLHHHYSILHNIHSIHVICSITASPVNISSLISTFIAISQYSYQILCSVLWTSCLKNFTCKHMMSGLSSLHLKWFYIMFLIRDLTSYTVCPRGLVYF